jgi:hypothetical protein
VCFVGFVPVRKEGPAVKAVLLGFSGDAETFEGRSDVEGGGAVAGDDNRLIGDSKLESMEPMGEDGGSFNSSDGEGTVGG